MEFRRCEQAIFNILSRHASTQGSPNEAAVALFAAVALLGHLLPLRDLVLVDIAVCFVGKRIYWRHDSSSVRMKESSEVVTVEFGFVPGNLDNLGDESSSRSAFEMNQKIEGVCDVALDRPVRQFDTALQNATGEAVECLGSGVGVDCRNCAGMSGIQQLQQVKGFGSPNLAQQDSVGTMAKARLEQFADGHGGKAVLLTPGFKADQVRCSNLNLRGVLDDENAFVFGNEACEDVEKSRLAGAGSARDEDVSDG